MCSGESVSPARKATGGSTRANEAVAVIIAVALLMKGGGELFFQRQAAPLLLLRPPPQKLKGSGMYLSILLLFVLKALFVGSVGQSFVGLGTNQCMFSLLSSRLSVYLVFSAGLPSCAHIQNGLQHGFVFFHGKTAGIVSLGGLAAVQQSPPV